jgi:hypothetical protein
MMQVTLLSFHFPRTMNCYTMKRYVLRFPTSSIAESLSLNCPNVSQKSIIVEVATDIVISSQNLGSYGIGLSSWSRRGFRCRIFLALWLRHFRGTVWSRPLFHPVALLRRTSKSRIYRGADGHLMWRKDYFCIKQAHEPAGT